MAITAINNVRLNSVNTVNFTGKKKKADDENSQNLHTNHKSNKLATVPVVVMMAMSPAMLNGKQPITISPENAKEITELVAESPNAQQDQIKIRYPNRSRAYNIRLNIAEEKGLYRRELINMQNSDTKYSNRRSYTMYITSPNKNRPGGVWANQILLIPYDSKDIGEDVYKAIGMTYHNIGKDKEYCGLIVKNLEPYDPRVFEIRIPDEAANQLIYLQVGETPYENATNILDWIELKSPALLKSNEIRPHLLDAINTGKIEDLPGIRYYFENYLR